MPFGLPRVAKKPKSWSGCPDSLVGRQKQNWRHVPIRHSWKCLHPSAGWGGGLGAGRVTGAVLFRPERVAGSLPPPPQMFAGEGLQCAGPVKHSMKKKIIITSESEDNRSMEGHGQL